jgi:hypothetical protein
VVVPNLYEEEQEEKKDRIVSLKSKVQWLSHQTTTTAENATGLNANKMDPVMSSEDIFKADDIVTCTTRLASEATREVIW